MSNLPAWMTHPIPHANTLDNPTRESNKRKRVDDTNPGHRDAETDQTANPQSNFKRVKRGESGS